MAECMWKDCKDEGSLQTPLDYPKLFLCLKHYGEHQRLANHAMQKNTLKGLRVDHASFSLIQRKRYIKEAYALMPIPNKFRVVVAGKVFDQSKIDVIDLNTGLVKFKKMTHIKKSQCYWYPYDKLLRFTGRYDKNGKELYEEDQVTFYLFKRFNEKHIIHKGIIRWSEKYCGFLVFDLEGSGDRHLNEVIEIVNQEVHL